MLRKLLSLFLIILMLLITTACDKDDPADDDKATEENVTKELQDMDEKMGEMMQGSPVISAILGLQMISGSMFGDIGLQDISAGRFQNLFLSKHSDIKNLNIIKADSSLISLIAELEGLYGTHTYNADSLKWFYSDQPSDEVILIYPFTDLNDNSTHTANIRLFGINITMEEINMSLAVSSDGNQAMTLFLTVDGNNFLNPSADPSVSSVNINGSIYDMTGLQYAYEIDVTESNAGMNIGLAGISLFSVTATGSNIISQGVIGDELNESVVEEITIKSGENLEIVITDMQAASGKAGDVYYKGEDVGDVVVEDEDLMIEFNSGNEVSLSSLLPNTFGMLFLFGGIMG
ncbi:MAG: hypothetical protein JW995_01935 [Melioribacteraceae bacterium]|nr:hypothetical protein [Melioribacteraceae bacterium]